MTEQRRLAAILVADVAGYSRLMGSDEGGTLAQLEALRTEIIEPLIANRAGEAPAARAYKRSFGECLTGHTLADGQSLSD